MRLSLWCSGTALSPSYFRTELITVSMRMCFVLLQDRLITQDRFFGKAALGLIQDFSFNWLYFEIGMGILFA